MNDTIPYGHINSLKMLKGLIGIYKSQDRQHNGQKKKVQKNKQRSTKHYAQNQRSRNTNPTKNLGWTHVLRKGKQFLLH
jgi:hypothetical protein